MKKILYFTVGLFTVLLLGSCESAQSFNLFSLAEDSAFGAQMHEEILANPAEYPILDPAASPENEAVYDYVEGIMTRILQSDEVENRDTFEWHLTIIDADVLNAFAAPGGYLYFYTGFLKFAESEAELAGVMAHEIAHSDRRHSTQKLTKVYGIQVLLSLLVDENSSTMSQILAQMAAGGSDLAFTRENEYEADEYAMRYMHSISGSSGRNYNLLSMQDFFNRMEDDMGVDGSGDSLSVFLRTHPYNDDREAAMTGLWESFGSPSGERYIDNHRQMKELL